MYLVYFTCIYVPYVEKYTFHMHEKYWRRYILPVTGPHYFQCSRISRITLSLLITGTKDGGVPRKLKEALISLDTLIYFYGIHFEKFYLVMALHTT